MARKHTIYGLYDPSDREVRYVGSTKHEPEQRLIDHVCGARRFADSHKQKWIRKLLRQDLTPAITVLEVTTSRRWKERECYWIATLRSAGNRLTNSTEGGEGLINPSKDVRRRIAAKVSAGLIGNQRRKGKLHPPEIRKAISEGLKNSKKAKAANARRRGKPGHPMSEANKQALIASLKGVPRPWLAPIGKEQAEKNRGSYWVNNGKENLLVRPGERKPKGFVFGRMVSWNSERVWTEEARAKISAANTGKPGPKISAKGRRAIAECKRNSRWITNGVQLKQIKLGTLPPPGWRFGRKLEVVNSKGA